MPRRPRLAAGDLAYHVLNRRVGRLPLFDKPADYAAFEKKWVSPSPKYVRMGADDRVNRMQDGQQPPVGRGDESTIPERVCG